MKRRDTILALLALGATPLATEAQQAGNMARIGYFVARGPDATLDTPFHKGLRDLGYEEGRNIIIVRRFAHNRAEALTTIARELGAMNLDVIVVAPHDAALAMKKATAKTPIVMATGADPIGAGLIASLRRPGGNVTGLTNIAVDLTLRYRIPTSTPWAQYADAGGLIAYGPKLSENFYRAANYVDMILRGANPAELPMQQPTSFELVINLKAARALGMQVPANLLLRADRVIE